MLAQPHIDVGSREVLSLSLLTSKCRKSAVASGFRVNAGICGSASNNTRYTPGSVRCQASSVQTSSVKIEERLKSLHIDSAFVVDPQNRPDRAKHQDSSIPVIDLSPFFELIGDSDSNPEKISELIITALDGNNARLRGLINEVQKACEDWGFFQVTNHGVPLTVIDELQEVSTEFFHGPLEEKRKIDRSMANFLGYHGGVMTHKKRNWSEVFDIASGGSIELPLEGEGAEPSEETVVFPNQWPEEPSAFQGKCEKFLLDTETLASHLMGLISVSLGLRYDHLHSLFSKPNTSVMRLNYYPVCPIPDLTLGVGQHRDWGALTVLVQSQVGGLEVRRKDGEWISVEPRRDAYVINLADMIQVWTNDRYKSVLHRAVVNENKERLSFPFFYNPSCKTRVEPLPELLNGEAPKYRSYSWGLFQKRRNESAFSKDKRPIDIEDFAI